MTVSSFDKVATLAQWRAEILHDENSTNKRLSCSIFNPRFSIIILLLIVLFLPWQANAQELRPKPSEWKIKGALAAFEEGYPEVRAIALDTLRQLGSLHYIQAFKVAKMLKYPDPYVRSAAARALGDMGNAAKAQAPLVVGLLRDPLVGHVAAEALGKMGEAAQAQIPEIVKLLGDQESYVRYSAAEALGNMGDVAYAQVEKIAELLSDPQSHVRLTAAKSLGKLGDAAKGQAPQIAVLLRDSDWQVRSAAAQALNNIGDVTKAHKSKFVELLKDPYEDIRAISARTLGNMGEVAKENLPQIVELLKAPEWSVRSASAEAIGHMSKFAKEQVPAIAELLKDINWEISATAALALGNIGEIAKEQAPQIADLLKDPIWHVRLAAVQALGNMGEAASVHAPQIAKLLRDPSSHVRSEAFQVLRKIGKVARTRAPEFVDFMNAIYPNVSSTTAQALWGLNDDVTYAQALEITELLKNKEWYIRFAAIQVLSKMRTVEQKHASKLAEALKDIDWDIRPSAVIALGHMGEAAKKHTSEIAELLNDHAPEVRSASIRVLGSMGEAAWEYAPRIAELVQEPVQNVSSAAAQALGNMGEIAKAQAPKIAELLKHHDWFIYVAATQALGNMAPLDIKSIVIILSPTYYDTSRFSSLRFIAHFAGGGQDDTEFLVKWLGKPLAYPQAITYEESVKTLRAFEQAWEPSASFPRLRKDLAEQIAVVAQMGSWKADDLALLQRHADNLKAANSTHAAAVENVIAIMGRRNWLFDISKVWLAHALFWLLLIFVYPKSPQIQAIFFWNAWVRRLTGLGYVGFALTWVPYLRAKLFAPFKESLLADAALESFDTNTYFAESEVKLKISGQTLPIAEASPEIKGQIVLEGESGLGKTMFLRHLVQRAARIVVYLPAEKCAQGVIEAIQAKLHGQVKDADFLQSLIYSGAMDIIIDGLNEVTADTRAKITMFVESYFKGNIIMATQPLEWTPPATAKTHIMQPLSPNQIERFLLTRKSRRAEHAAIAGSDYEQACKRYLAETLVENQPSEILASAQRILSNPMDLTVVAQMLAAGQQPDLFRLQEQQYQLMAEDYQRVNNSVFPLRSFSEEIYQMRLADRLALPAEKFFKELLRMEHHKMVVSRQSSDAQGKPAKQWYFRHDKIMEFFIVQTFLGENNERPQKHLGDPRFRGVYFLLATLLPLEEAKALREHLIQYAADTKDHTVSDTFIQLLRTRKLE